VDNYDKKTYDFLLHKVNNDNPFGSFYFNFFDKNREQFFELNGIQYKFSNYLEDKNFVEKNINELSSINKNKGSTLINTQKIVNVESQMSGFVLNNNNQPHHISNNNIENKNSVGASVVG
jgi:hypothetical protein